jgi:hypothetical protein
VGSPWHHGAFFLGKRAMMPNLYLDHRLSSEIERLAVTSRTAKSIIAPGALQKFFKYQESGKREVAIRMPLDQLSRAHERLAGNADVILKRLTVYVNCDFMRRAQWSAQFENDESDFGPGEQK